MRLIGSIALVSLAGVSAASGVFGSYLGAGDSPFSAPVIEDFEDGSLNTPGIALSSGSVLGPGPLTDSVDEDDGSIDGNGNGGHSWYVASETFTARFAAIPYGAGLVVTDIGFPSDPSAPLGFARVEVKGYDGFGALIDTLVVDPFGDGAADGGTKEDVFFGFTSLNGVSRIDVLVGSADWELDHVQYEAVPEPATMAVVALGALALRRRRRNSG
jgi:hypothetical protein